MEQENQLNKTNHSLSYQENTLESPSWDRNLLIESDETEEALRSPETEEALRSPETEEDEMYEDLIPRFSTTNSNPFLSRFPFRPNNSHQFYPNDDPISSVRSLTPQNHPLNSYISEISQNRRNGRSSPIIGRRIIFPPSFTQLEGADQLPPHLQEMIRGEQDIDYDNLIQLSDFMEPVSRGASKSEINALPTKKFVKSSNNQETQCVICSSDYEETQSIKMMPKCLHSFHSDCIDKWLGINKICPVCRSEINN